MNILERLWFRLRTGHGVRVANDGKPVDSLVIRYKDLYFDIDLDLDTGLPTGGFGWSSDPTMSPIVTVRDIWTAQPPARPSELRNNQKEEV